MADPTAAQIAADVTQPTYAVQLWNGSGWSGDIAADVVRVTHEAATSGDLAGFGFGTGRAWSASIAIDRALFGYDWRRRRVRIGYGFGTSDAVVRFVGVITGRDRDGTDGTWACAGLEALVRGEKLWSPLLRRRPGFTATSVSSIEDPANTAWRGGLGNWILWQIGGRPLAQAGTYPSALFYYDCEQAIIAPEWSWTSGENPWNELDRLCKACGGQVFQDDDGVLRYTSPTGLAANAPSYTFTDAVLTEDQRETLNAGPYETKREQADTEDTVTAVTCSYTSRVLQGYQEVYGDTEARIVAAGATVTLQLDTQLPIYSPATVRVEYDAGIVRNAARPAPSHLVATITGRAATRFTLTLQNTLGEPIVVYALRLFGRPISAGEPGGVSYSTTSELNTARVLEIPDNPFIQARSHAERLARMVFDYYAGERGLITLTGCPYDPRRFVGEPVYFTSANAAVGWNETATPCRITAIRPGGDGFMDVDLGRAAGLPIRSEFFVIGQTYASADVRQMGY